MSNFEPIVLSEYGETLVIESRDDEKIPLSGAYIGTLKQGNYFVYAVPISETYYILSVAGKIGKIGKPIPVTIDTFEKLREWCSIQIVLEERKLCRNLGDRLIDLRDATMEVKRKKETEDIARKIAKEAERRRSTNAANFQSDHPGPVATGPNDWR